MNRNAWFMICSGALLYCYQFIVRVSPNMMTDELMRDLDISAYQLSSFISLFHLSYALTLIPLGLLMDRYGPKKLVMLGALVCGLGCFSISYANSLATASVARFLMGLGASAGFLGTLKIGTLWLPREKLTLVVALALIFSTVGALLGGTPLEWFINNFGWRMTMRGIGVLGSIICMINWIILKDKPQLASEEHPFDDLKTVMSNINVWKIALYSSLMYCPLIIFGDLWGVTFLEKSFNIPETQAAPVIGTMFIGVSVGSLSAALISNWLGKRKVLLVLAGLLCFVICSMIIYGNTAFHIMYVLFFLAGFCIGGKTLSFSAIVDSLPISLSGIAVGFTNTLVMANGVISLPLFGFLLNQGHGSHSIADYTLDNFRGALSLIPICLFIGFLLIISSKVKEYPKKTHPIQAEWE